VSKRPSFLSLFLGSGFYSGFSPVAPGTFSSFFAVLFSYGLALWLGSFALLCSLFFWCFITLFISPSFEAYFGEDPSQMTADEWAGQIIPFLSISFTGSITNDWWILLTGFLFFRFFDILKPLGIKYLEKLPGGYGILLDDLLSGVYALISLKLIIFIV